VACFGFIRDKRFLFEIDSQQQKESNFREADCQMEKRKEEKKRIWGIKRKDCCLKWISKEFGPLLYVFPSFRQ
jgi:hypothetical protein